MNNYSTISNLFLFLLLNVIIINHFHFSVNAFVCEITLVDGSPNQILTTHCLANGQDFGNGTMDPYTTFSYVTPVVDGQRSVITCDMALGNLQGKFQVFDSDVDGGRCRVRALDWRVDENGLFALIDNAFVQRYHWP
ncbi:hypothetical protein ABFS82_07G058000 [Erythranthe guttata]